MVYGIWIGKYTDKLTLLVKGASSTRMLEDEGLPAIKSLDKITVPKQSSWYAGAPHNVVKPKLEQALCDRCHGPGTALLKESDLQFPEAERRLIIAPLKPVVVPTR